MTTAYEEALNEMKATGSYSPPDYINNSDALSIANGNQSFLESAADTVEAIPKFIAVSLISGANQLYNIVPDVGNLIFDHDFERSDAGEVISGLDSDLGAFYREHQEGADLVGFMIGALVPGSLGIKVLNAGQTSLRLAVKSATFGKNTGRALGLLRPRSKAFTRKALTEVRDGSSTVSILNGSALKATAAGVHQGLLEGLFFEVAVASTMFNSPILENQEFGDFVSNIAFSAGLFGIIGGGINAIKLSSALKTVQKASEQASMPFRFREAAAEASVSYEKIALISEELDVLRHTAIPTNVTKARRAILEQEAKSTETRMLHDMKIELNKLAKEDMDVAAVMMDTFKNADKLDQQGVFIGLIETLKSGVKSKIADRYERLQIKLNDPNKLLTEKEIAEYLSQDIRTSWAKMWGEDAGRVLDDRPILTALTDVMTKKGQSIRIDPKRGIYIGDELKFAFDTKFTRHGGAKPKKGSAARAWTSTRATAIETQARLAWVSKLPRFAPSIKNPITIHVDDIPMMEKLLFDLGDEGLAKAGEAVRFAGLKSGEGEILGSNLLDFIVNKKLEIAFKLVKSKGEGVTRLKDGVPVPIKKPLKQDEIAAIVNVRSSMLNGEVVRANGSAEFRDVFALQSYADDYTEFMIKNGTFKEGTARVDIWNVPQHVKLVYNLKKASQKAPLKGINNFVVENMVIIQEQQKLYTAATSIAAREALLPGFWDQLVDISREMIKVGANSLGAGHRFVTAESANYGTLAAFMSQIGNVTSRAITAHKDAAREVLEPLLYRVGQNRAAAVELAVHNANLRSIKGNYGLNEAGDAFEPLVLIKWKRATAKAMEEGKDRLPDRPILANPDMPERIEIVHKEVREYIRANIEINGNRTIKLAGIRTSQGLQFNRDPEAFYPIPVNIDDYPHFAMVKDRSVTSTNQSSTIYANSAEELEIAIRKLRTNPELEIYTKADAELYYKRNGQFVYEKTLSDNYLDHAIPREGASAPYIVPTNSKKIIDDTLNWHMQRETGLVREAVSAKYEVQFAELLKLGEDFTNIATSKFSAQSLGKFADDQVKNPFNDYIKTALAIRKTSDYPFWTNLNKLTDRAFSKFYRKLQQGIETARTPAELAQVNRHLQEAGYKGAAYDETMSIFANSKAAKGVLSTTVRNSNSVMAAIVLRLDQLNAAVNAVSANVLLGAETASIVRLINNGGKGAVDEFNALTRIGVPGAEGQTIFSPWKLIGNAFRKFGKVGRDSDEFRFFKDNGFMTRISDQHRGAMDGLTFDGVESIDAWGSRIFKVQQGLKAAAEKGERWTGNRLAEEFNRFVAADVMKQMTDVAISKGLMTPKEALSYINTFVNRTQGNYLAAQRPGLFQGPIGQAIGLFQTYQFNLMQQLLRHVGEGHAKDAMTLLGLQATIHGLNGLPAFNAVNTHLLGTASGNQNHKDAYDAVYGTIGKEAGDWLMYGLGSNAIGLLHPDLKVNLYVRGDINPRHLLIVPTNPSSIPIVQASYKVFKNIFDTANQLAAGGDISSTLLRGLEHNGISRPLAGLAQTLEGLDNPLAASYSTSKKGNLLAANDLLSLANLARLVGGKPLDEAIALDATYRFKAYGLADAKRRANLGMAIKSTLRAGNNPTQEQINDFAGQYAETGGRQKEFAGWFTQLYKDANTSQANALQKSLTDPYAQKMQVIMGGEELGDFDNLR